MWLQGNCTDPPEPEFLEGLAPEAALLPIQPGQCLIISDTDLLRADGELWVHNLYVRLLATRRNRDPPVLLEAFGGSPLLRLTAVGRSAAAAEAASQSPAAAEAEVEAREERRPALWLTQSSVQGDGDTPTHGVRVDNADLYAEGAVPLRGPCGVGVPKVCLSFLCVPLRPLL